MSEELARLAVEDRGPVRILTLEQPARRNALTPAMLRGLRDAVAQEATAHVRAFVVRGGGEKAFCSGYDLQSLDAVGHDGPLPDDLIGEVFHALEAHPAPSVACLNGGAFGAGFELATVCDFRIAAQSAQLGMPPARLGVVYAPEGLQRLIRLVGFSRAKLLFLTGRTISAAEARAMGLVDELRDSAEEALLASISLAEELAKNAPLAVSGMKRIFTALGRANLGDEEREQLRALRRRAFNSDDVREGRAAFLEKRPPRFQGR